MSNDKIIQIIPAPPGMWIDHPEEVGGYRARLVCLALVEDQCGERYVEPFEMTEDDAMIEIANYGRIVYDAQKGD